MAEPDDLVDGVTNSVIVRDRTEVQASDGMDEGDTRDPS